MSPPARLRLEEDLAYSRSTKNPEPVRFGVKLVHKSDKLATARATHPAHAGQAAFPTGGATPRNGGIFGLFGSAAGRESKDNCGQNGQKRAVMHGDLIADRGDVAHAQLSANRIRRYLSDSETLGYVRDYGFSQDSPSAGDDKTVAGANSVIESQFEHHEC